MTSPLISVKIPFRLPQPVSSIDYLASMPNAWIRNAALPHKILRLSGLPGLILTCEMTSHSSCLSHIQWDRECSDFCFESTGESSSAAREGCDGLSKSERDLPGPRARGLSVRYESWLRTQSCPERSLEGPRDTETIGISDKFMGCNHHESERSIAMDGLIWSRFSAMKCPRHSLLSFIRRLLITNPSTCQWKVVYTILIQSGDYDECFECGF